MAADCPLQRAKTEHTQLCRKTCSRLCKYSTCALVQRDSLTAPCANRLTCASHFTELTKHSGQMTLLRTQIIFPLEYIPPRTETGLSFQDHEGARYGLTVLKAGLRSWPGTQGISNDILVSGRVSFHISYSSCQAGE